MKRKYNNIAVFFFLLSMLLSACSNDVKPTSSVSPAVASTSPTVSTVQPSLSSSPSPSPPPDVTYTVKTDYSHLTPFEPPEEIFTRLSPDYMPELVPSDDYGLLLPYIGRSFTVAGGYMTSYYYGLVTKDGMMVTDPVFIKARRVNHYELSADKTIYEPFYILALPPESIDADDPFAARAALCALDGSWVTQFDYTDIYCYDKVMLLIRDAETNDADVMDYSGKLLYNTKSLACYNRLPKYCFHKSLGEVGAYGNGLYMIRTFIQKEGKFKISYWSELTGELIEMAYDDAVYFCGGLAAVCMDGLWGYIDTDFEEVIKPQFKAAGSFIGGYANVTLTDGSQAVIDPSGNTVPGGEPGASPSAPQQEPTDYMIGKTSQLGFCLMTKDGKVLAPIDDRDVISHVFKGSDGRDLVILTNVFYSEYTYKLIRSDGVTICKGTGYVMYHEEAGLIEINDQFSFGYADTAGNFIFRISLLDSLPD